MTNTHKPMITTPSTGYQMQSIAKPDFMLSPEELRIKAEGGDASAQFLYGCGLRDGDLGCNLNKEEGEQWIVTASKNGTGPAALCAKGFCYAWAVGPAKINNTTKANECFEAAVKQGYVPAMYELSRVLRMKAVTEIVTKYAARDGYPLEMRAKQVDKQQLTQGMELLSDSAEAGYSLSIADLAYCFKEGNGVSQDSQKALTLFRSAADTGSSYAKKMLGNFYRNGQCGLEINKKEARQWYEAAAAQGRDVAAELKSVKKSKCCSIL